MPLSAKEDRLTTGWFHTIYRITNPVPLGLYYIQQRYKNIA
jgi:hypothetical protein